MRKRIAIAAICLFLGVVTTYAVAWYVQFEVTRSSRERVAATLSQQVNPTSFSTFGQDTSQMRPAQTTVVHQGWPLGALRFETHHEIDVFMPGLPVPEPTLNHGVVLPEIDGVLAPLSFMRFALQPQFPGSLIATCIYGLLAFGAMRTLSTLRRHHRWRRKRCPSCNYNLSAAAHTRCPECGASVRANALP